MDEDRLELYKQMYYFELEQKEKINSRVTIPLGVIVALIGLSGYLFKYIRKMPNEIWVGYYRTFLFIFIALICISIMIMAMAYYGYEYMYICIPSKIEENYNKTKEYYDANYDEYFKEETSRSKDELIKDDFNENIIKQYIETTDNNSKLNEKKLNLLRKLGWTLLLSVVSGGISYLLFIINYNF